MRRRGLKLGRLTGPLMAMAAVLLCSPLILYPPGRDQSVFLLAGRALAGGAIPYRDFWDIKPPGLFLAYLLPGSLAFAWPGAAALIDLAALAVAIMAAHRLLADWGAAAAGPPAAILLGGLWAFAGDWWDLGQGERLAIPLLILALLAAGRARTSRWLAAGLCIGAMTLLKSSFLPLALALLPLLPRRQQAAPAASPGRLLMAATLGALAPLLLVALALAAGGALGAAHEAIIGFTGHYTRLAWERPDVILRTARVTAWAFLRTTWPLVLLATAAVAMALFRPGTLSGPGSRIQAAKRGSSEACLPRDTTAALSADCSAPAGSRSFQASAGAAANGTFAVRRGVLALVVALAVAGASVFAQGKFFPYHWIAMWPALILLAALGAAGLVRRAARRRLPAPGLLTLAAMALAGLALAAGLAGGAPGWPGWRASLARGTGSISDAAHLATFRVQGMGYDELVDTARRTAAAVPAGEPILMWGFEPAFYLYARRSFPGRFPFAYPLVTPWAPAAWREEFLADFDRTPPAAIVVRRGDPIPWVAGVGGDAAARLNRFPGLVERLRRDYQPRPQLSSLHLQVWQRVAAPAGRR